MILGKNFKFLPSLCMANMKLERCLVMFPSVGKVILTIYGDFLSMSSFNIMKQVSEHGTGFLVPPSRCCCKVRVLL